MTVFLMKTMLTGVFIFSTAIYAGPNHDHGDHHEHYTPEFEHKDYGSVASAWAALNTSVSAVEIAVDDNEIANVHDICPELAASTHYLLDHSNLEDPAKQTRLKAALNQLSAAIDSLEDYSHFGNEYATEAGRELKKIQGALRLIEAYYPADVLQPERSTNLHAS